MFVGKGKGENKIPKEFVWTIIFKIICQEDNQISMFGCPHSFFGCRGHEDTRILLPCIWDKGKLLLVWYFCGILSSF